MGDRLLTTTGWWQLVALVQLFFKKKKKKWAENSSLSNLVSGMCSPQTS